MSENAKQTSSDEKKKDFRIRPFTAADYPQMREIYEQGLNTGHATYETRSLTFEEFKAGKIMPSVHVAVEADDDSKVLGWVSAAPVSTRTVFHGVVEDSIYLGSEAQGRGIGGALTGPSAFFCKHPPEQVTDDVASQMTDEFIHADTRLAAE